MSKEKKSVAFSTRFTEGMDKAIDELSDVMMLTKHEVVRAALSEYLLKNKYLIDKSIDYKSRNSKKRYDDFDLVTVSMSRGIDGGKWIVGVITDEDGEPLNVVDLVKIEVNIPIFKDKEKIPLLLNELKSATEEEKANLHQQLSNLMSPDFVEEYTLRYTVEGVEVKEEPRFQQYLEKCIEEMTDEVQKEQLE